MKNILLSLLLVLTTTNVYAKPKSLDFQLKLGQYKLNAPYYFSGDLVTSEGYLISVADLALLKIEIDSFQLTLTKNLELLSQQCQKEISQCQEDADQRFVHLVDENEILHKELALKTELYESQKTKTILYAISGILATGLTSFIIVKTIY